MIRSAASRGAEEDVSVVRRCSSLRTLHVSCDGACFGNAELAHGGVSGSAMTVVLVGVNEMLLVNPYFVEPHS